MKVIWEKIKNLIYKINFQYAYNKYSYIKTIFTINIFFYKNHEMSEYALDLIAGYVVNIIAFLILL